MRIVSWNVNGLRACAKKGFAEFLESSKADIVCLQEVRALPEQLSDDIRNPKGFHTSFFPAQRLGYSGVAIYSREPPTRVITDLGAAQYNDEGRFIAACFGRTAVASIYFPKGNGPARDNSRVPYKLGFYAAAFERLQQLRKRGPVWATGDYNTAHHAIDLARPKSNVKSSGFLPAERFELDRWCSAGWVDTFRANHPDAAGHYTWWRQFGGAKENNVGWRVDYVFASPSAARRTRRAFIWPDVTGSDHCPVGVDA